jgi:hypothetical protein
MLHSGTVVAEQQKPPDEKGKMNMTQPGDAVKKAESLTYTGIVVDKVSGRPIAGATVTVRRSLLTPNDNRILEEPQYKTDAAGKYNFTIPPEQVADRHLYIELDVTHPDYAPRRRFGDALSIIRKNEAMGGRPFFERVELMPAEPISGTIVTPDGRPATGVKVLAFPMQQGIDFDSGMTDKKGGFHLHLAKGANGILWLLPKEYAPSTQGLFKKRGDLGRFVLQPGIPVKGRVVDLQGKPVAGVWVNAQITGGPGRQDFDTIPFTNMAARSGLTDSQGRFTISPLAVGKYLLNVDTYPDDALVENRKVRPVPGVFGQQLLTLKQGMRDASVEIREIPTVAVEGQFYDSHGRTRSGHAPEVWAQMPGTAFPIGFFFTEGQIEKGRFVVRAPKGLQQAKLSVQTDEYSALRLRMKKGGPLMNQTTDVDLGTLASDVQGIEVVRYEAPILLVRPVAEDGAILKDARFKLVYAKGRSQPESTGRYVDWDDVTFERQTDGRLRSEHLLPDEQFTVTVNAAGYRPKSETLKLPEGAIKELTVQFRKAERSNPSQRPAMKLSGQRTVDDSGIIREGGRPVGVWGVDDGELRAEKR